MSSKRAGSKSHHCIVFEKSLVDKWIEAFGYSSENGDLLIQLLLSRDLDRQLECLRKVSTALSHTSPGPPVDNVSVINCLVEIHSHCSSRHVLQRNTARCIDKASQYYKEDIQAAIKRHLLELLSEPTHRTQSVDYIQSLMENYTDGERSLSILLPHVLCYLIDYLQLQCKNLQNQSSVLHNLFMSHVKVLLNVLHRSSPVIIELLSSEAEIKPHSNADPDSHSTTDPHTDPHSDIVSFDWPNGLSKGDHIQWTKEKLQAAMTVADVILHNEFYLPKDLIMSVSMLYIVAMTIRHHNDLTSSINELFKNWFAPYNHHSKCTEALLSGLSICHALIAKTPPTILSTVTVESGETVFFALFPVICSLLDHFTESSHKYLASRTLAMWTGLISVCLNESMVSSRRVELTPDGDIVKTLLKHVWSLWEDPVEGIRYQCRSIFESLIHYYIKGPENEEHLLSLARLLLSLSSPTRGKYSLLSSLIPHLSVALLLMEWPHLPTEIMNTLGLQVLACRAGELWSAMVVKHYRELQGDISQWIKVWLSPLLLVMLTGSVLVQQHVKQYCLSATLSVTSNMLDKVNDVILTHSQAGNVNRTRALIAQLSCMECIIMSGCGLLDKIGMAILSDAIELSDEQIVMSSLHLLCESKRSTDLVPLPHLPLISQCLELHMNTQSPAFRNEMITVFKKLLCRMCDSSHCRIHFINKKKHKDSSECESAEAIRREYKDFLKHICQTCFKTLHPLSNFQRRNIALSYLNTMSNKLDPSLLPSTIRDHYSFPSILPKDSLNDLAFVLYDTFDDNRTLSLQLLDKIFTKTTEGIPPAISLLIADYHNLITSPKSTDCATGHRMTQLLVKYFLSSTLVRLSTVSGTPLDIGSNPLIMLIKCLLSVLNGHVTIAGRSLVRASLFAPMYGVIQAIRSVLEQLDMRLLSPEDRDGVGRIIMEVVDACVSVGRMVSPVVCNTSPEGFVLSEDDDASALLDKNTEEGGCHGDDRHGNAQSLLVCCWRSMKETIQLLSVVIDIVQSNPTMPFEKQDVISDLILHQLTRAYHRGAFEIAHVGFVKLCTYLWGRPSGGSCRPVQWVNELIESLRSPSMTELLAITRRSAGLPFYVQAILTTEPSSTGRSCLKHVVSILLDIASSHSTIEDVAKPVREEKDVSNPFELVPQPSSVHALNILRGLFKDNKLGEVMTPYVTQGLKIAITGFSVQYWPVRNSCTLLFSSLVMRVFGVKRVQDERSIENKMPSREFFSRFPSLHSFLLEALSESEEYLYPVLLLLSRLYPSPLDDASSPLSMDPFQPLILNAAGSPIWKCRVLASDAFLPTLSPSNISSVLSTLSSSLSVTNHNKSHGIMLILSSILRHSSPHNGTGEAILLSLDFDGLLTSLLKKVELGLSYNKCHITRGAYIDLITQLLIIVDHTHHFKSLKQLVEDAKEDLISGKLKGLPLTNELPPVLLAFMDICNKFKEIDLPSFTQIVIQSWAHYSEYDKFFDQLLSLLDRLNEKEMCFVADKAMEKSMQEQAGGYKVLTALLQNNFSFDPSFIQASFETTSHKLFEGHLREDTVVVMINWLSTCLHLLQQENSKQVLSGLLATMSSWCCDLYPIAFRFSIAGFLGNNWKRLIYDTSSPIDNVQSNSISFWSMVVLLLQDVEEEVRNAMCESITPVVQCGKEFRDSLCQQLTLKKLISSVPVFYSDCPTHAYKVLMHILSTGSHSSAGSQDRISAMLFEEDKSNSYAEPVELMETISVAVRDNAGLKEISLGSDVSSTCTDLSALSIEVFNPWKMDSGLLLDRFRNSIFKHRT